MTLVDWSNRVKDETRTHRQKRRETKKEKLAQDGKQHIAAAEQLLRPREMH